MKMHDCKYCSRQDLLKVADPQAAWMLLIKVSSLNPDAGEIGEGMLRTLIENANRAIGSSNGGH